MATQLTVNLPDHVYERARRLAELTGRDVADVLVNALDSLLPPLIPRIVTDTPVESLPDDEVIGLAELQMETDQDNRLSELLDKQQAGDMNEAERIELQALMRVYEIGMARKAEALAEAVRRGLREPLEP